MKKQPIQKGKEWLQLETRPFKGQVVFFSVFTFIIAALTIVFAYLVRYLLNAATAGNQQTLLTFAAILVGIVLVRIALQTWYNYQTERLRSKIVCGLRLKIFSHVLRSNYPALQSYHSGDLLTRLTADVDEVAKDTVGLLPSLVGLSVQCIGAIVALLTIDLLFTSIYVASGLVLFALSVLLKKYVKKYHKEYIQADGESRAYLQEGAANVTTVKAYGAEEKSVRKAEEYADSYHKKRMQRNKLNALTNVVFSLLSNTGMIFALIWCSVSVLNGYSDYGAILSIILLLMQLKHPFASFSSLLPVYYAALASAERLSEISDLPKERIYKFDKALLYEKMVDIDIKDVSFEYEK
ncbi:MAG: ABC transporter ATP-binding protein [Clostridia bacterium]|nr:ABC transporter ATP-binding protein [Clostridia bacterium]